MSTILAISDMHSPAHHRHAIDFLKEMKRKFKPTEVVCLGDEVDSHALSDYEHDPDGYSAGHELEAAVDGISPLYDIFPEVAVCVSNHGARPFRRAKKFGIPMAYMKTYREFMRAPKGWRWEAHWDIDGIRFIHGEGYSGSTGHLKAALALMQPVVIGHLHSNAGVAWAANPKHLVWGMNTGCLIDAEKYSFEYGRHNPNKPIIGCGVVVDGRPQFIAMKLRKGGEWNGEL